MTLRDRLNLDGTWHFWTDPDSLLTPNTLADKQALSITVPAPWQSQSEVLLNYSGVAWYQRPVEVPADWLGGVLILGFGAVDHRADVWFNGVYIGGHEGGYLPFTWNVTAVARPGTNHLTVRVDDPVVLFNEIPHGKQSWYGQLSGIWQSVWLERRSPLHIYSLALTPVLASGTITVRGTLAAPALTTFQARVRVLDDDRNLVAVGEIVPDTEAHPFSLTLTVPEPCSWSPDAPYLYEAVVELFENGQMVDQLYESFGFRTIQAHAGHLYLNGAPLYLRGALDQDYYPDTICTPPSTAFLEKQIRQAKALGLNCLRLHIKIPDPRYYEVADRLGMLIWTELPNWHLLTEGAMARARDTLAGMVARDGNHPSIIAWTIVNEDWGTNLAQDSGHRTWLIEMYHWLKALDPTRLVIDNSPCIGNFHVQSDVEDYHFYKAVPDQRREWDTFVDELASRTALTYSPFGDAERTGQEPLLVSEFGNWGLPNVDLLLENGQEPWWFETGLEWNEAVYPHGVQQRFERWGLRRVFGSWQHFIEATQWQEFYALKYEIEAMRRRPEIAGYVITEFTDVHWECNGLLDMRRNPKGFHKEMATINADTVIVPQWERTAYWAGEPITIALVVAHGGSAPLPVAALHYGLTEGSSNQWLPVAGSVAGQTQAIGKTALSAPETEQPFTTRLQMEVRSEENNILATNHLPLAIYPRWRGPRTKTVRVWAAEAAYIPALESLGYGISPTPEEATVIVAHQINDGLLGFVREGKTILLVVQDEQALGAGMMGMRVQSRHNTIWRGDWASSFAWVRREGSLARLPGGPLLDYSFDAIIPDYVLTGVRTHDFNSSVHAGLFVGWIHRPVALLVEQPYGKGRLITTTFRLRPDLLGGDPTATTLWDALVEMSGNSIKSHRIPLTFRQGMNEASNDR